MDSLLSWIISNSSEKHVKVWQEEGSFIMKQQEDGDRVLVVGAENGLQKNVRFPIPPECILRMDTVIQPSVPGQLFEGLDRYTMFAMFLLYERRLGDASFWKAYLDVLPTDIGFHPITFMHRKSSDEKLAAELQKEPLLLRALEAQNDKLMSEYEGVKAVLEKRTTDIFKSSPVSYEEFLWANCMVISRAFDMSEPKVMCMLPFADSMNHNSQNPSVQWRPRLPKGFFVVRVLRDLEKGEELTANYHGNEINDEKTTLDAVKKYVMYGFLETETFLRIRELV